MSKYQIHWGEGRIALATGFREVVVELVDNGAWYSHEPRVYEVTDGGLRPVTFFFGGGSGNLKYLDGQHAHPFLWHPETEQCDCEFSRPVSPTNDAEAAKFFDLQIHGEGCYCHFSLFLTKERLKVAYWAEAVASHPDQHGGQWAARMVAANVARNRLLDCLERGPEPRPRRK